MKRAILILALFVMLPKMVLVSQCIDSITDELNEELVSRGFDLNNDGWIDSTEAANVHKLDFSVIGFNSVIGLCNFTNLDTLICINNINLPLPILILPELPSLKYLDLSNNNLGWLDISGLSSLEYLDCSNNNLSWLNLQELSSLEYLDCSYNSLSSLDLPELSSLEYLDYSNNSLTWLDLSKHSGLKYLDCSNNDLYTLDPAYQPDLEYLDCSGNNLIFWLNLTGNDALRQLILSDLPALEEVCVRTMPFPPADLVLDTAGSPEVWFTNYCERIGDRMEENDDLASARGLEYNKYYSDLFVSDGDDDWYLLPPNVENIFMQGFMTCKYDPSQGDIQFELVDSEGQVVALASSGTGMDGIRFAISDESPLYLHIHLSSGNEIVYSLKVDCKPTEKVNTLISICNHSDYCGDVIIEPAMDDTIVVLDTMKINMMSGDRDLYALSIANKGPDPYTFLTGLFCNNLPDNRNLALRFNGNNEFVRVFRNPSLDISGQITLETWICPSESENEIQGIISKGWQGYGYELYLSGPDNARRIGFCCDAGTIMSRDYLENGRWYHVAATYDGSFIRLYLNGELNMEQAASGNIKILAEDLYIGSCTARSDDRGFFSGSLDEVRIWDIARKTWMIKTSMSKDLSGDEPGLIGCWNMNDKSAGAITDRTSTCKANIYGNVEKIISGAQVARMIVIDPLIGVIQSSLTGDLTFHINAEDLPGGEYNMNVDLFSNSIEIPDLRIPVQLTITDAPSFSISADTVSCGKFSIYSTHNETVTVRNTGSRTLTIDSIRAEMYCSRVLPPSRTIEPGESSTFNISLCLKDIGEVTGDIIFYTNDPTGPERQVILTGEGTTIEDWALLLRVDTTLCEGNSITKSIFWMNPSGTSDMILYPSVKYYTLPEAINDNIPVPDSGSWVSIPVSDSVILPPLGAWIIEFTLDASSLDPGTYYAVYEMPWFNPSHVYAFIPIVLHVTERILGDSDPEVDATHCLHIYPNPTPGPLTLETNSTGAGEVFITGLDGRVLEKFPSTCQPCRIDLSDYPPGIYFVTVVTEDEVLSEKIIRY